MNIMQYNVKWGTVGTYITTYYLGIEYCRALHIPGTYSQYWEYSAKYLAHQKNMARYLVL